MTTSSGYRSTGADQTRRTFIKVCGLTRVRDVRAAVSAGVSAVGFVFARSPRRVTPARAIELRRRVHPTVGVYGVFVDMDLERVVQMVDIVGLDGVQLQGSESVEFVEALKRLRPSATVFKVIRAVSAKDLAAALDYAEDYPADAVFIDPKDPAHPVQSKGPIPVDWLKDLDLPRLVVAGGLHPDNVGELVRRIAPWGVDVSSGVESSPGKKDAGLMAGFVRAVREAEA